MRHPDAQRWNERYQKERSGWQRQSPRKLLVDYARLLPSTGVALDVASGVATNSIYLAERGLQTFAMDISIVGLRIAKHRFRAKEMSLNAVVLDLKYLWLPADHFDVIVNFCFLERRTFPVILHSLKPGGILFFETYLKANDRFSRHEYYLESGELLDAFSEFEVIHTRQLFRDGGEKNSGRMIDQLVARKPKRLHKRAA